MAQDTPLTTQVAIVGGGPAGLLLSHLLRLSGVDSVVLELRDREYALQRVRAGVLEQGAVELLTQAGLGDRIATEGMRHSGINLQFDGQRHNISFQNLIGRSVWVYGQQEVVKDLIQAHDAAGTPPRYSVSDVTLENLLTDKPLVHFVQDGQQFTLQADFVVGADGAHGVCRPSIPDAGEEDLPARVSVRLARHPGPRASVDRRAHLRAARARLRDAQHARRTPSAASTCRSTRTRTSRTGRTSASGTSWTSGSASPAGRCTAARSSTRASPRCTAS